MIVSGESGSFFNNSDFSWTGDVITTSSSRKSFKKIDFSASKSSAIYGSSSTVQNPAVNVLVAIRY